MRIVIVKLWEIKHFMVLHVCPNKKNPTNVI